MIIAHYDQSGINFLIKILQSPDMLVIAGSNSWPQRVVNCIQSPEIMEMIIQEGKEEIKKLQEQIKRKKEILAEEIEEGTPEDHPLLFIVREDIKTIETKLRNYYV